MVEWQGHRGLMCFNFGQMGGGCELVDGEKGILTRAAASTSAGELCAFLHEAAKRLGFDLCGVAPAHLPEQDREGYLRWLEKGFQGEMKYMERPPRQDIETLLPGVRSVICAGMVYNTDHPPTAACDGAARGWVSRYAWGEDYHAVLRGRLETLLAELRSAVDAPFQARVYVDTGPLLERALAQAAGLGWIAKNTCLIHPQTGSWFVVGIILTTLELKPDAPLPDRCGTCRRCIDACPTAAIVEPYVLDATRCISYLTIELKGSIPEELRPGMGRHVFGCDICQDVCPWNRKAPLTGLPEFQPRLLPTGNRDEAARDPQRQPEEQAKAESLCNPSLAALASLSEAQFRDAFRNSPVKRARHRGLLRNVAVAMGNSRQEKFRPALERLAAHPDPLIQDHALWALAQLRSGARPASSKE